MVNLKFDEKGLIPAVVQDASSGDVIMVAYMDREAISRTIKTGLTWFYSRSRQKYWQKGETSGNIQKVKELRYDCDVDCLLVLVDQTGVGCHTGQRTCFHKALYPEKEVAPIVQIGKTSIFQELFETIENRKKELPENSYTTSLFKEGLEKIIAKVEEESGEVIEGARKNDKENIIWESADLIYHLFVLLADRGISLEEVEQELAKRRK
jgi:phosphoribosyl-ATP pyrophosphohydrolase/phosphoribosyl-AMP cyclohydrolase